MQAVLLAAGKSTRTLPLTATRPKPLLRVAGTTLLEWNLAQLAGLVDRAVIVTGHGAEEVEAAARALKAPFRIAFVRQRQQKGTADALRAASSELEERFLVLNGDDLYQRSDLAKLLAHDEGILAAEERDPEKRSRLGALQTHESSKGLHLVRIDEKPAAVAQPPQKGRASSALVNIGAYLLRRAALSAPAKRSARGEDELTDLVSARAAKARLAVQRAAFWQPVGYPWQVLEANEKLLAQLKPVRAGTVEPGATLKGAVSVGPGTTIRAGAYIEGPVHIGRGCDIGPNCYIRASTSIGDRCRVGNAVELKNCVIGSGSRIGHLSYLGDSVLGEDVNIGAGTIAANLRHDGASVWTLVNGKRVDSGRRKLGAIIGDGAHTGIHTSIYPGRKLWPRAATLPGEVVKQDKLH